MMAHRDNISRVYKDIHEDDKSNVSLETTTGLWSGDTSSLTTVYTSGTQIANTRIQLYPDNLLTSRTKLTTLTSTLVVVSDTTENSDDSTHEHVRKVPPTN